MNRTVTLLLAAVGIVGAAAQPLPDTLVINDWLLCGPLPVGTREGIAAGVEDPAALRPVASETLHSGLVQGGAAIWHPVRADSLGWLETAYDSVRWDSIQDYYGNAGLLAVGFASAEFQSEGPRLALAVATRLGGFILNGRAYAGDIYGNGWFRVPVLLNSGVNRVVLRLSGYGDQRVQFMLVPPPGPVLPVAADATTPDLLADSAMAAVLGLPLVNTTVADLDSIRLRFVLADTVCAETIVHGLPALGCRKLAVTLNLPGLRFDSAPALLTIATSWRDYGRTDTVRLRLRHATQAHKVTFISRNDSSCQYYAILYPKDYDPSRRYALILSLHGAGVEASGLADCFRPKDWAFVACPTNRRPFGFDWQDWGRLDAVEVLDRLTATLPVDPNRICLTGHSMGGHGTWHVGLTHADRFAAIAPEAGWPTIQLYVPTFLQRSVTFAEPTQLAIRDMALRPDNTPAMLENAVNLPVFILHGGDDDNVPTIHGRNFAAWLAEMGYRFTYKEVPGQKHWWSYPDGTSCVDDTDLMAFLESSRRSPGPRHIRFRTADLAQSRTAAWVAVDRMTTVGRDATVEAWADDSLVRVTTSNVSQLRLDLDERLFFPSTIRVVVDGQRLPGAVYLPAHIILHRTRRGWVRGPQRPGPLTKAAALCGPAKQAMMAPFIIAYGTADTELTDYLRHAATQEAMRWWLIGNGDVRVLSDTAVSPSLLETRNLVLYGGPEQSDLAGRLVPRLPVRVAAGRMLVGNADLGDSLAAIVCYPNPLSRSQLVLVRMGTDSNALKLSTFWGIIGSSAGVPDFMVFDRSVRRYGWAGARAAGFFGSDWNLDPASLYIRP